MSTSKDAITTVLVVEDDRDARDVYSLVLEVEGYAVVAAENGARALSLLKEHHVDAIVTDLLMPIMDGLDFATAVKADPRYADVPIILLSARNLDEEFKDIEVFSALLRKPCSAEDLTSTLAAALARTAS
jgi:CheY-like chemotaxis protein